MSDDATLQTLQTLAGRELRSVLQYVVGAFPWATVEQAELPEKVRALVAEERDAVAAIARYLFRHHVPPPTGGYPTSFTALNFVAVDALIPRLVEYEQKSIARLEADLDSVADADARKLVQALLDVKRKHLDTLRGLAPEPMVTA
jgi:hypothetical protein